MFEMERNENINPTVGKESQTETRQYTHTDLGYSYFKDKTSGAPVPILQGLYCSCLEVEQTHALMKIQGARNYRQGKCEFQFGFQTKFKTSTYVAENMQFFG